MASDWTPPAVKKVVCVVHEPWQGSGGGEGAGDDGGGAEKTKHGMLNWVAGGVGTAMIGSSICCVRSGAGRASSSLAFVSTAPPSSVSWVMSASMLTSPPA